MIITNTIDTDLIVLSYVEPSILAYMKTINSNLYNLIKDININNNNKFKLTKALINTQHFLENNFDNILIHKTEILNICVQNKLNLDELKWLYYIKKCNPDNYTFENAAQNGNSDILKWMFDNNFPKNEDTFANAAKNGNLDILKWMLNNNFPKDEYTFAHAAQNGNFDILKWMLENNFPKNKYTFACAAENDDLYILKWMLENNFPKDECTFEFAALNGNLDILKWMLKNNFPKNEWTFTYAVRNGNLDILKWMLHNKFPYYDNDYDRYIKLCQNANIEP